MPFQEMNPISIKRSILSIKLNDGLMKAVTEVSSTFQPFMNRIKSDSLLIRMNFFSMEPHAISVSLMVLKSLE